MYLLIRQTVLTGVKYSFEYLTVFPGGCGKEGGEGGWERGGGSEEGLRATWCSEKCCVGSGEPV